MLPGLLPPMRTRRENKKTLVDVFAENQTTHCSICLAFGNNADPVFSCNIKDKKHEQLKSHSHCPEAYMACLYLKM